MHLYYRALYLCHSCGESGTLPAANLYFLQAQKDRGETHFSKEGGIIVCDPGIPPEVSLSHARLRGARSSCHPRRLNILSQSGFNLILDRSLGFHTEDLPRWIVSVQ